MSLLARPNAHRGEATEQARAIARFADSLENELERWRPYPPREIWAGVASDRQRTALEATIAAAWSIINRLRHLLTPLMALEQALDVALGDLMRLQRELDDARAAAVSSLTTAESDARAAQYWARGADVATSLQAIEATARAAHSAAVAARAANEARQTEIECVRRSREVCAEFAAADLGTALRIDASFGGDPASLRSRLHQAPPEIAQHALEELRPAAASTLVSLAPEAVATLPASPLLLRYEANRVLVRTHVATLMDQRATILSTPPGRRIGADQRRLEWLERQLAVHSPFLEQHRQLLEWDPHDDGRVVEVLGDAATATHIAVVVPGITNTVANFDQRLRVRSNNIYTSATALDPDTAVIAWLGYDTPGVIGSVSSGRALDASRSLTDFIDNLPADRHVSLIAHSYGTVVAGFSARTRLAVDELVLVGSPGTPLDQAGDARLSPGGSIWAASTDSDLVGRVGPGTHRCPQVVFGGRPTDPWSALWPACRLDEDGDVLGLVHGRNPSHTAFGATEIATTGARGHSEYFDHGTASLDAISRIVVGHPFSEG